MSVARFTGVVPLLLLLLLLLLRPLPLFCRCCTARMLLKFRGSVGWTCPSLCPGWHAHIMCPLAHTEAPFLDSCHKTKTLKHGCCFTLAAMASKAYYCVIQAYSSRQHSENDKSNESSTTPLFLRLFLVPTAVESYNDTCTHMKAHEPTRRSTVRGCHKGENLKRGCCTVAAEPLTAGVVLQKQQQICEK